MGKEKKTVSKSFQVNTTLSALNDIDEIVDFIAYVNGQPLSAIRVGDAIFETIGKIEQNPFAYKQCEALPTKTKIYRQAVCLSWLVIYKIAGNEIIILGIIHGARHPSKIRRLRKLK